MEKDIDGILTNSPTTSGDVSIAYAGLNRWHTRLY